MGAVPDSPPAHALPHATSAAVIHRHVAAAVEKLWTLLRWIGRARKAKLGLAKHMADFTHLHLHTQYSLLDGAIRLDDLFPKVLERGMKPVAITDHGNLFGALDFYQKAKAARREADLRLRDLRRARSAATRPSAATTT